MRTFPDRSFKDGSKDCGNDSIVGKDGEAALSSNAQAVDAWKRGSE